MLTTRNWRTCFQVHVWMVSGPVHITTFALPGEAFDYAWENVAHNPQTVSQIEVRAAFGTETLETVFDASWR